VSTNPYYQILPLLFYFAPEHVVDAQASAFNVYELGARASHEAFAEIPD